MEIKKLTSDVCISCKRSKEDSYKSHCRGCYPQALSMRDPQTLSMRACLGCGESISSQFTACDACCREQPYKLAINELFTRVADLEARLKSVDEESSAKRLIQAFK